MGAGYVCVFGGIAGFFVGITRGASVRTMEVLSSTVMIGMALGVLCIFRGMRIAQPTLTLLGGRCQRLILVTIAALLGLSVVTLVLAALVGS
jgi:hypothetical protein